MKQVALFGLCLCASAQADVVIAQWIGPSPGTWDMAERWSGGIVPDNTPRTQFDVLITKDAPRGSGASFVTIATGAPVIDTLEVGAGAQLSIAQGAQVTIAGDSIVNDGTIALLGSADVARLYLSAPVTMLDGAGAVEGVGIKSWIGATTAGNRLVIGNGQAIRGSLALSNLRVTNHGLIDADSSTPISMLLASGETINGGTMRASNGSMLAIYGGGSDFINEQGTLEAAPGSILRFGHATAPASGKLTVYGGVIRDVDGDGPGRIEVRYQQLTLSAGVAVEGAIHIGGDSSALVIAGDTAAPGLVIMGDPAVATGGTVFYAELSAEWIIKDCTIVGHKGTENRVTGTWSGTKGVIAESALITGSIALSFESLENFGTIDVPADDMLNFFWVGGTAINQPEGVIRFHPGSTPGSGMGGTSGLENRGLLEIGAKRTMSLIPGASFIQSAGNTIHHGRILTNTSLIRIEGGEMRGAGECVGFVLHEGGAIVPERESGATGTFKVHGNYLQGVNAIVDIEIGGGEDFNGSIADRIAVTGAAELAGTLRVRTVDGFMPVAGDVFTVLTAGSVVTGFNAVDSCRPVSVAYTPTSVLVTFTTDAADLDADGLVDGADLTIALGAWGSCTDDCCAADLNGDGVVDGADLATILAAWTP